MGKQRATVRPLRQIGISENKVFDNASLASALREVARYLDADEFATVLSIIVQHYSDGESFLEVIYDCPNFELND